MAWRVLARGKVMGSVTLPPSLPSLRRKEYGHCINGAVIFGFIYIV